MRTSPTKKTMTMKLADDGERGEGDGVGDGAEVLPEGERRHDLRGGLAHQRGDGNDGVAVGAQRVDQEGQRGHGDGAVAAAIVHQDDGAAELRLGLHGVAAGRGPTAMISCGRLARVLVPVVGVDLVADDGEPSCWMRTTGAAWSSVSGSSSMS